MRRLILTAALLLLLAAGARGETIRFDPPSPTAHHSVDATVSGIWRDGCLPSVKSVFVSGATILLHLNADHAPDVACVLSLVQYARTFHLEVLPAGSYTVIAVAEQSDTVTELARTPLIVRDAETLTIRPYAVSASGGEIAIDNPFFHAGVTVTIGGQILPLIVDNAGPLIVKAPSHAPGAVDVAVSATEGTLTTKAALIYYDQGSTDPALFEPILFPLSFQGPGAFGSQWTTDSFITSDTTSAFFRDTLPCLACSTAPNIGTTQLTNNTNPWGHVLYALRGTTGTVDFASRIRDTSRQSSTAGTEVPIVHERDFRGQFRFVNVPVDARFRTKLRVWSLGDYPQFIVNVDSLPNQVAPLSVTRIPGTAMWFGAIDVTSLLSKSINSPVRMMVYPSGYGPCCASQLFPPIWGMLSITNNDTQQVTIVSPH